PLFDPWERYVVPPFPLEVLPPVAQRFVTEHSGIVGCDPSALAMAVLATFSGALHHPFALKLMRHGRWWASPRLWGLLVGDPSRKKTPCFNTATRPLEEHEHELRDRYEAELEAHLAKVKPENEPKKPPRYCMFDTTTEKLGAILAHQDRGLLVKRDEIAGWV